MAVNLKTLTEEELFYGAKTCQGCGALMACRMTMKVMGPKSCVAIPACCMAATTTVYPQSSLFVNNAVTAFPGLASTISGMAVGGEVMGWDEDTTYVAFGGDGGTVDIGIQALSGAAERNDNIIYICYDNDAYMNTGVHTFIAREDAHINFKVGSEIELPVYMPRTHIFDAETEMVIV